MKGVDRGSSWRGTLKVAGLEALLTIEGAAAIDGVLPAFSHLTERHNGIDEPCASEAALPINIAVDETITDRATSLPRGPVFSATGAGLVHHEPPAVNWYERDRWIELRAPATTFSNGRLRAQPANGALSIWLADHGALWMHVGAVVVDGRAAVLVGSAGAGKSTTSVACALAGAGFVGDDFCAVDVHRPSGPTIHSVYGTAKLLPDADRHLGQPGATTLGWTAEGKRVVAMTE
ncbi:MAG: hypothetical protein AAFY28_22525, partial [Actinomycetota bacterium]